MPFKDIRDMEAFMDAVEASDVSDRMAPADIYRRMVSSERPGAYYRNPYAQDLFLQDNRRELTPPSGPSERDITDISNSLFQTSRPPSPAEGEGGRGDGGRPRSVPQNLDGRTLAGRQPGARTVFGTDAWTSVGDNRAQRFTTPAIASPCVARRTRRQVMFALGHGGRGYRVRHRKNEYSDVEC